MTKKSAFSSLRTKQLLVLLVAIACAAAAYFVANWIGDTLIEKVYLDQKAMQKRERAIVSELQTYVQENRISSRDTDAVARWSMSKSDTYVMLYRNQRLAFEAGWWGVDDVDETDAPPLLSNSAGVYPIYFTDGPMQAVVYDFSESRLYTLTTIVSVLIGCFVLMCFMLSYNSRITRTIVTIAAEVEQIGRGDLTARLEKPRGNDELAGLTESVERMRASLLHKTEEEQKALKQNSDLITALSHDIRNPLTALLGYLDIISAQRDLPPDTASYLAACQERAGRIKQLTDELFRYSLLFSNDELPMRLETYDAYVLLEQLLGEAQAELESAGFATRMVMPDTFCRVRVDVPYFKRVLDNLFANVRKYADPAQPVSIAALPENRTLHICICNTIRADSGQVESNKIGLRTAEKILTQMGGSFRRHEAEGKFTAEAVLPIVPEETDE